MGGRRQGGGERGKLGPRDGIPYQTANRLPVSNQRLPEILDGWHPQGGSRISFPEETRGSCAESEAGTAEGIRRTAPGESALIKLLAAWAAPAGRHKTQAQPCLRLCGVPKNLNLSGLGLGRAHNSGPTPWRAAWSLSSIDRGSTHPWVGGRGGGSQCGQNTGSAPHTRQWHFSAVPLPPHSTTEQVNLNKRSPLPTCVRVEISHWRDL